MKRLFAFPALSHSLEDPNDKKLKHLKTIDHNTVYGLLHFLYTGFFD